MSERLSMMMSIRLDHLVGSTSTFEAEKVYQTTYSPKFGLVYQLMPDRWVVFANYLNGFVFLDPAITSDPDGTNRRIKPFDPEQANQFEIGTKAKLFANRLEATLSLYTIDVYNKLMTDITNTQNFKQGGKVNSKGIELTLHGTPLPGLTIIGGYSHNYNQVTKSEPSDANLGLRPEEAGPANLFNAWIDYEIQAGTLKNLNIGMGVFGASSQRSLNRLTLGAMKLPSYTFLNGVIGYQLDQYNVRFKIDNMLNRKYFTGNATVNPQALRTFLVSFNYSF
ncbi:TonB-dependent siderophore receptor [Myroides pelagicus]|uniref:TonB-dependent siderophore receptor n=1 Tax=Myroides pelagicus TaxID=270914 RepID=UPI002DB7ED11|nr:TonB-dependent receptor [Myroides pelagicus]